jgi:hypothetical protein
MLQISLAATETRRTLIESPSLRLWGRGHIEFGPTQYPQSMTGNLFFLFLREKWIDEADGLNPFACSKKNWVKKMLLDNSTGLTTYTLG